MRKPIALIPAYALALIAVGSPAMAAEPTPQELAWAQMTAEATAVGMASTGAPPPPPPPPPPPSGGGNDPGTGPAVEYDFEPNR